MGAIVIGGLATGAIYGLMAIGVVVIYRSTKLINFAQGEVMMFGAYAYWLSAQNFTFGVDLLTVLAVGIALGLLLFVLTHYLIRIDDVLTVVVATLGVGLMMINLAQFQYGATPRRVPGWLTGDEFLRVGGGVVSMNAVLLIPIATVLTIALEVWFRRARTGQAVRAVAESPEDAALSGISVRKMKAISWVAGCAFAALSGLLVAPEINVHPHMAFLILFSGFVAAAVGGFTSVLGAMVGGLVVGLGEALSTVWVDAELSRLVPFILLVAVVLFKPHGIFESSQGRTV